MMPRRHLITESTRYDQGENRESRILETNSRILFDLQIPAIVYFEKEIPNVYDGDLMDEEQILKWLLGQLERDEIEDVTDEMLDTMIKEGRVIAVLFCKYLFAFVTRRA